MLNCSNIYNICSFYKNENMPEHYGMTHNCIMGRYHLDQKCTRLMWKWWNFVNDYTVRDQCSLMYILWKNNLKDNICILKNNDINFNYIDRCKEKVKELK